MVGPFNFFFELLITHIIRQLPLNFTTRLYG